MILVTVVDSRDQYDEYWIPNEYAQAVYDFLNTLPLFSKI